MALSAPVLLAWTLSVLWIFLVVIVTPTNAAVVVTEPPLVSSPVVTPPPPRVICLVVADDLGFSDVSYHGSYVQTPFIDSLAKGGVRLANYYGQSICTPSRAAIMTGRFASHTGLQHSYLGYGQDIGLPTKFRTLAQHLSEAGGYEAHIVGKWHVR